MIIQDAAAAALFIACKIEDTLKRSREILCAAYNMRTPPAEHLPQDDPVSNILVHLILLILIVYCSYSKVDPKSLSAWSGLYSRQ